MFITKYVLVFSSLFSFIYVPTQLQPSHSAYSTIDMKREKTLQVRDAQLRLKKLGFYRKPINRVDDDYTRNSIAQFQTIHRLPINGILNQDTRTKLHQLTTAKQGKPTPSTSKMNSQKVQPKKTKTHQLKATNATSEEVRLLAKAVHSEARGEKFSGKVAVSAVILNRTETKGFPRTIKGVIYEPKAFTAVSDGQFALKPSKEAYKAAREALRGVDPTKGATFYFNPEIATSGWMFDEAKKHKTVKIGKHVFFKE
ncbi:cell wall hydrolase [Shimazuella alba]|uniref:Spore cortex-lytic enzyme n=1 Tax=Shimazuella alba TaxID=2690964 RepID=A0A6I4W0K3_9BACL|nr:cell wall hydrolase [Shimazuella alba]MXQ53812.1 spore cortex-lytic enzyme [Shimazuella alba]